jgi:hypothetical protein
MLMDSAVRNSLPYDLWHAVLVYWHWQTDKMLSWGAGTMVVCCEA